jgi:hypoxia up-regulated 1
MDAEDRSRREREESRNILETQLYASKELLWENDIDLISSEKEKNDLTTQTEMISEWLEDHAESAQTLEFKEKLEILLKLKNSIVLRKKEKETRPVALETFEKTLEQTLHFLQQAQPMPKENEEDTDKVNNETTLYYPSELLSSTKVMVEKSQEWYKKMKADQDQLDLKQDPILLSQDLFQRADALNEILKGLGSMGKPRPKKPKTSTKSETTTSTSTSSTSQETPVKEKNEDRQDL